MTSKIGAAVIRQAAVERANPSKVRWKTAPAKDTRTRLIKKAIRADPYFHQASRLAWRMTELAWKSGLVTMSLKRMRQEMCAGSIDEIKRSLDTITKKWGLFRWDAKAGGYVRLLRSGESSDDFKERVQQTVRTKVGVAWILSDITSSFNPAPHTNDDFAKELNYHPTRIGLVIKEVLEHVGYFKRAGGDGRGNKSYYTLANRDDTLNHHLEDRYGVLRDDPKFAKLEGRHRSTKGDKRQRHTAAFDGTTHRHNTS